jgi:alkanesulfonate monooxygenase SsuD/methylene tetrahydromethanopterin reductase-like flavin-dependent oxidoreductase (luciferase family)
MTVRDGPFNWQGEHFHYRQVNIWLRPWQQPHPDSLTLLAREIMPRLRDYEQPKARRTAAA